jgi:hypothetical protein
MEERQPISHETREFVCPNCESPAFETIRTERAQDVRGVEKEYLVMRCLNCMQFFTHELTAETHIHS